MDIVDEILSGSWDLHVHSRPDPEVGLRLDALDTARRAQEAGMAGFVLKSHYYPTAPVAEILTRVYPGLTVVGAVALNDEVGGLNARAVEAAAKTGARVVWMPTFSAHHFTSQQDGSAGIEIAVDGKLVPEVLAILEVARSHEMTVASGHVSPAEAILLFHAARDMGITRLIATHPDTLVNYGGAGRDDEARGLRRAHVPVVHAVARPHHTLRDGVADRHSSARSVAS